MAKAVRACSARELSGAEGDEAMMMVLVAITFLTFGIGIGVLWKVWPDVQRARRDQ